LGIAIPPVDALVSERKAAFHHDSAVPEIGIGTMTPHYLDLAEEVIRASNRENPADAVLARVLRGARRLDAVERRQISHAVFCYYRWLRWLDAQDAVREQLQRATDLARKFRADPLSVPVEELRSKVLPDWVADEVGYEDEWLRSLQQEPRLWLRARRGQAGALSKKLPHSRPRSLPEALVYDGREDLFRTPEFHAGEFELQDVSSQAVGILCDPHPGETWWDACAGEGGKTLHLSNLMENRGLIWATDRAPWRLAKLKRRAGRAGVFNYRAAGWDGGMKLPTKTKFDGVLLDAPCSGIGTWQRNPHARWTTTPEDVAELGRVQERLLAAAAGAVKPGGKLVYAVCSLTQTETVAVADGFDAGFKDFEPLSLTSPLAPDSASSARIWIWPQRSEGNGMFVAAWKRRS
jgi:16S rRNA (cytosine967-C5)-methyltransferase